jgi:hypothetical protein
MTDAVTTDTMYMTIRFEREEHPFVDFQKQIIKRLSILFICFLLITCITVLCSLFIPLSKNESQFMAGISVGLCFSLLSVSIIRWTLPSTTSRADRSAFLSPIEQHP